MMEKNYRPDDARYDGMIYRRCGASGLRLPLLSLGLWHNFGEVDCISNAKKILHKAFDAGITHFDLANNYGPPPGTAEETFGKVLRESFAPWRDEMIISTKAGYHMWPGPYGEWGSRKSLLASLDQSLRRMGLDYVDIFYSHRPDPDTPLEETMGALAHAVRSGKALYAGVSNYGPEATSRAIHLLKEMGTPCLIHQVRYNLLGREPETGLLPLLSEQGVGCIAFSPLAQGILTPRYLSGEVSPDSRAAKPHGFLKEPAVHTHLPTARALSEIAASRGQSLSCMALAWVLRLPAVTSALIGVSSCEQLEENLQTLTKIEFSEEELRKIDAAIATSQAG